MGAEMSLWKQTVHNPATTFDSENTVSFELLSRSDHYSCWCPQMLRGGPCCLWAGGLVANHSGYFHITHHLVVWSLGNMWRGGVWRVSVAWSIWMIQEMNCTQSAFSLSVLIAAVTYGSVMTAQNHILDLFSLDVFDKVSSSSIGFHLNSYRFSQANREFLEMLVSRFHHFGPYYANFQVLISI